MAGFYRAFVVRFLISAEDPAVLLSRYHTALFVETEADGSGYLHEVDSSTASVPAMDYQRHFTHRPEKERSFLDKEQIGFADISTHPAAWDDLLSQIPHPPQPPASPAASTATEHTARFKPLDPSKFYEPGEQRRPLSTCTEWTVERAIPALRSADLLRDEL